MTFRFNPFDTPRRPTAIILMFLALVVFSPSAYAAKYAGDAFSLGVGGRGLAMGGAVIAGPFDGTAAYWNPAGMNSLDGRFLTAMHAETFGSLLNHDFIGYVNSRGKENSTIKAFGFYVYYLGGGGIKITQLNQFDRPEVVREESHGDYLFSASLSGKISPSIDFGLTAKTIYRDIGTESGIGLTVDAGGLYKVNKYSTLGLMVTDVTTGFIRYSGGTSFENRDSMIVETKSNAETIYPTVKPAFLIEYSYNDFTGRFAGSGDVKFEGLKQTAQFWSGEFSLDTHWGFELGFKDILFGRAGFDVGKFTAGGGIDIRKITVDFAYLHHDDLDETFRVSAGYQF